MEQRTHRLTSEELVGKPVKLEPGYAEVVLKTTEEMAVDEYGLVHGGFTFGLADYAAMLAVNEPTVVLGKAEVRFLKPVKAGEKLLAKARILEEEGGGVGDGTSPRRKKIVRGEVFNESGEKVFEGIFHCYVLEKHVLE
ncbi:thioesterase [Thermococcus siculi]|uniref:Thioesterase n=1 Tax=Thermococcus siculi TaxID=72803 RepID=A0A2Z2MX85_9EURY|nr:PaaI family thioesterase [Thermococcus siculi]ASJ08520.1 thioesterase [Thermococcus siculi]